MASPQNQPGSPPPSARGRALPLWIGALLVLLMPVAVVYLASRKDQQARPRSGTPAAGSSPAIPYRPLEPDSQVFASYAGSASCRECHAEDYEEWSRSHHGLAERPLDPARDHPAFDPPRTFQAGSASTRVARENGVCLVETPGFDGSRGPYPVERVIGETPLRQFLVAAPGGRQQTLDTSYDPDRNEWFNVYGEEDRQPGEWGHWTGRGMNWNAMCASCHNTRLRKHYDAASDTYATTMAEMTVSCESCHGPMRAHVDWRRRYPDSTEPDPGLHPLTADQVRDACAACHSRRTELTGDFHPGESYFDHYGPAVPDETEMYYADGQVREENYVFSSFLGSRMHAAGVRCLDCHQPHTAQTLLPGNALCLRCHNGSYPNSPAIDIASHTFHQAESPGSQCVNCHMPETVYMQNDARRDHGFTIPDPLLTKEHGIPNACNRCHTDQDADWALAAVQQWYGDRMERPSRQRARTIARARRGREEARQPVLELLTSGEPSYWRAVGAELAAQWSSDPAVAAGLIANLSHPDPLVRGAAAKNLDPLARAGSPTARAALETALQDPSRMVRIYAAYSLRDSVDLSSTAGRELTDHFNHNADQPTGLAQLGAFHHARGNNAEAIDAFRKAVQWDPRSTPLRHELAVLLSMEGRITDAVAQLEEAVRLEPDNAEYQYKLALGWNEQGDMNRTVASLRRAVELDPRHARAWYNLGLAYNEVGKTDDALDAMLRAQEADPRDPRIPYAVSTILESLGRTDEARAARQQSMQLEALQRVESGQIEAPQR